MKVKIEWVWLVEVTIKMEIVVSDISVVFTRIERIVVTSRPWESAVL